MDFIQNNDRNDWQQPESLTSNRSANQQPTILPKVVPPSSEHTTHSNNNNNNDASSSSNNMKPPPASTDFVNKLFSMLEEPLSKDIVRWTENGDSFVVVDPSEFTKSVLPRHFKHSNFASFVRQLNKYDFHKVRTNPLETSPYGENAWEFKHPDFQLHNREQLENIKRKTPAARKNNYQQQQSNRAGYGTIDQSTHHSSNATNIELMQQDIEYLKQSHQELKNQLSRAIDSIDSLQRSASTREHYIKQLMDLLTHQQPNYTNTNTNNNTDNNTNTNANTGMSPIMSPAPLPPQMSAAAAGSHLPHENTRAFTVLLGEDDEDSVRVCRKFLNQYGCDVDVANDGLEAVHRTQACGYDLILIDSVLPSLDGASATELIRNSNCQSPIIIMVSTEVNEKAYYSRGVTGILRKPFKRDDLFKTLDAYLNPRTGGGSLSPYQHDDSKMSTDTQQHQQQIRKKPRMF